MREDNNSANLSTETAELFDWLLFSIGNAFCLLFKLQHIFIGIRLKEPVLNDTVILKFLAVLF